MLFEYLSKLLHKLSETVDTNAVYDFIYILYFICVSSLCHVVIVLLKVHKPGTRLKVGFRTSLPNGYLPTLNLTGQYFINKIVKFYVAYKYFYICLTLEKKRISQWFWKYFIWYMLYTWKLNICLSIQPYQALMLWSYHTHQFNLSWQFYFNLIIWHLCLSIASKDDYLEDKLNLNIFALFWFVAKNKGLLLNFSLA